MGTVKENRTQIELIFSDYKLPRLLSRGNKGAQKKMGFSPSSFLRSTIDKFIKIVDKIIIAN